MTMVLRSSVCPHCGRRCTQSTQEAALSVRWRSGTAQERRALAFVGERECALLARTPIPVLPGSYKRLVELRDDRREIEWLVADDRCLLRSWIVQLEQSAARMQQTRSHAARQAEGGELRSILATLLELCGQDDSRGACEAWSPTRLAFELHQALVPAWRGDIESAEALCAALKLVRLASSSAEEGRSSCSL